jgi:DNA-binding GntR family transcriptional regulator
MIQQPTRLSQLPIPKGSVRLDRNLLKDMAVEVLRDFISEGRIPEGTKITEREVSQLLDISRIPARDALMILEKEGLVESRSDGRYVVELAENDIYAIHQVRRSLEKLAVELAAANLDEEGCKVLCAKLHDLEEAVATGDAGLCAKRDMAIHREIWCQTNNQYLLRILDALAGTIFVLAARVNLYGRGSLGELLESHRKLVDLIACGDGTGAGQAIEADLEIALMDSLRTFRISDRADVAGHGN